MTVIETDRNQRKTATPFESTPWCDSRLGAIQYSENLLSTTDLTVALRMTSPAFASIIEAHITAVLTVGSSIAVKLAVGSFATDGTTTVMPSQSVIDSQNLRITGSSSGVASSGSELLLNGINLLPFIPRRGDATFNEDGFVLVMQFSRLRTTSDVVRRFDMQMSADLGIT